MSELKHSKIVLLGYMGSGKSTTGKVLARQLKRPFYDLDQVIESEVNLSIREIFDQSGAIFFRKKEKEVLSTLLQTNENAVISLGGGTPCYYDNMGEINNTPGCISIYLNASITTLTSRLRDQKVNRPLLKNVNSNPELAEFIAKHLFERRPFYLQATCSINVDHKTNSAVVNEILTTLN